MAWKPRILFSCFCSVFFLWWKRLQNLSGSFFQYFQQKKTKVKWFLNVNWKKGKNNITHLCAMKFFVIKYGCMKRFSLLWHNYFNRWNRFLNFNAKIWNPLCRAFKGKSYNFLPPLRNNREPSDMFTNTFLYRSMYTL